MFPRNSTRWVCTAVATFSLALSAGQEGEAQNFEATPEEKAIVEFTNNERAKEGLEALKIDPTLFEAARQHSKDMAKEKKLSHELFGKGVDDRVKALNYKYFAVGENVAWNEPTPEAVVQGWMKSPGHRENILRKDFSAIGVGVSRDEKDQPYYTQVFARPQSAGATAQASFTITNDSHDDATVKLPGDSPESVLRQGEKAMFKMSGSGEFPPVTVSVGEKSQEIKINDGGAYSIQSAEHRIMVSTQQPAEEAR
jgi:uncharacterized protein YkwD